MVSITGSVRAGKEVAAAAAAGLKRVHLELGGKAPVVVFDDADPAKAAEAIAIAGYFNAGPGLHGGDPGAGRARGCTTTSSRPWSSRPRARPWPARTCRTPTSGR